MGNCRELTKKVIERLCERGTTEAISLNGTNLCVMDCFTSLTMAAFLVSPSLIHNSQKRHRALPLLPNALNKIPRR
jgi:hypothetical protein